MVCEPISLEWYHMTDKVTSNKKNHGFQKLKSVHNMFSMYITAEINDK